jgi:hypothetical protein
MINILILLNYMQNHPLSDKHILFVFNLIKTFFNKKLGKIWSAKEQEESCYFAIHGGCIRDFYANCEAVDYDIIFDNKINMNGFVDFLCKFPISQQAFIKLATRNKYSNFGYKIEINLYDKKYILDICCAENAFLALDYTVNGLYLDSNGILQSKSEKYKVNTIIKHINDKKLVSVNPKEDNNTGLFELGVKRFLKTFFHKYGQETYEKIKERRKQKMLSKGYEEFKYFFPDIEISNSEIIIL